ncbi:hypothetical protein JL722_3521 [Aureococcus anophagefferens]|nr:hypothetical protein JL722_3521 [Aureococcus anophagefferens]
MEDTLRRQLENKRDWVFSYDFADAEPTAKPTSSPTFTPCDVEGEYRYYLALYDYGGDGWEGATYTLYKYVGVRQGEQILTGTVETGSEETAWMYLSFLVDGLNGEALISEAGFSAFAYAINDVIPFLTGPEAVADLTATFGEARRRQLLQAAGDDTASIEAVILMDTCAMAGHNSNDDCLDAMVEDVAIAIADGVMLERILYWADYFGLDLGDDFTVVSIVSDPEPYWDFTDEQNLPASDQISEQPAGDQPQALQKITQAAEL